MRRNARKVLLATATVVAALAIAILALSGARVERSGGRSFHYANKEVPPRFVPALPAGPPADGAVAVCGIVVDELEAPIVGATLALMTQGMSQCEDSKALVEEGRYGVTGADGRFLLAPRVLPASPLLVARHPEFVTERQVFASAHDPFVIRLRRGYTVEGRVLAAAGDSGIAGVRVVARGVACPVEAGSTSRVPNPDAEMQEAVTRVDGRFTMSGLPPGVFQFELVSAGLVTIPASAAVTGPHWSFGGVDRAVFADSRSSAEVVLRALPVACAIMRAEAADGSVVVGAGVEAHAADGLLPWTGQLMANREVVVANGRRFDGRSISLGTGEVALLFAALQWPIAGKSVRVTVRADGWRMATAEIPLQPAGAVEQVGVSRVLMIAEHPSGSIVLEAVDAMGRRIGDVCSGVSVNALGGGRSHYINLRTGADGSSSAIALPIGSYEVGCDEAGGAPAWEAGSFEIRESEKTVVRLTLAAAAVRVSVVDDSGLHLDDVGLLMGVGHEPVRQDFRRDGTMITITGLFSQCPGLGPLPASVRCLRPGPWTFEAFRHGYEPAQVMCDLKAGKVAEVAIPMRARPEAEWNTWNATGREPRTRLSDVLAPPK